MPDEFISEEIEVRFEKKPGLPSSFVWRGVEYEITEVKQVRQLLDFRRQWWQRRHRDYYVVETKDAQTFEIYRHRGAGRRYWALYRRLEKDNEPERMQPKYPQ